MWVLLLAHLILAATVYFAVPDFSQIWNQYDSFNVLFMNPSNFDIIFGFQIFYHTACFLKSGYIYGRTWFRIPIIFGILSNGPFLVFAFAITGLFAELLICRNNIMEIHHATTLLLLLGSEISGYKSHALLIMFLMDFSDVFMYSVRIARIRDGKNSSALQIVLAICTLIVWGWLRIYKLGEIIFWTAFSFSDKLFPEKFAGVCLLILLFILFVINLYWVSLLFRKFVNTIIQMI